MSEFSEIVLNKIKKSEHDGLEKQRRISHTEKYTEELQSRLSCLEKDNKTCRVNINKAKTLLLSRKTGKNQLKITKATVEELIKRKKKDVSKLQEDRVQTLKDVTNSMDSFLDQIKIFSGTGGCGLDLVKDGSNKEVREAVETLIKDLEEKYGKHKMAVENKKNLLKKIELLRNEQSDLMKLKESLESEWKNLDESATYIRDLDNEVNSLHSKVIGLIKEGRLSEFPDIQAEEPDEEEDAMSLSEIEIKNAAEELGSNPRFTFKTSSIDVDEYKIADNFAPTSTLSPKSTIEEGVDMTQKGSRFTFKRRL